MLPRYLRPVVRVELARVCQRAAPYHVKHAAHAVLDREEFVRLDVLLERDGQVGVGRARVYAHREDVGTFQLHAGRLRELRGGRACVRVAVENGGGVVRRKSSHTDAPG